MTANWGEKESSEVDYEKKIQALEEELKRKDEEIEDLREKNKVLFETAVKNSEKKVDTRSRKKVEEKDRGGE